MSPPNDADEEKETSDPNQGDRGVYYAVLARLFADIDAREDEDAAIHGLAWFGSRAARYDWPIDPLHGGILYHIIVLSFFLS